MTPENATNVTDKLIRLLRPSLVVLCGPSACGKSTFAKKHFRPTQVISSDWARGLVCDDERDQRFNTQAFDLVYFLLNQRLPLNRLCVVDSTALTAPARRDLLALAKRNQVPSTALIFHVPLETCVERDRTRERSVGRPIIEKQFQNFELSLGAIRHEGFDQVLDLHNENLEEVRFEIQFRPIVRAPRPDSKYSPRPEQRGGLVNRPNGGGDGNAVTASKPAVVQSIPAGSNSQARAALNPPASHLPAQAGPVLAGASKK